MITIASIQVGKSRTLGVANAPNVLDRAWTTGIHKEPVAGPVQVGFTNLAGDEQADLRVHGGPDKAILAYAASHYPAWRSDLQMPELSYGAFGENLTITGVDESTVRIGDIWHVGTVRLQVSQPREPCWKLARKLRRKDLPQRVVETGRGGWYLRVLHVGTLQAGDTFELIERRHDDCHRTDE